MARITNPLYQEVRVVLSIIKWMGIIGITAVVGGIALIALGHHAEVLIGVATGALTGLAALLAQTRTHSVEEQPMTINTQHRETEEQINNSTIQ